MLCPPIVFLLLSPFCMIATIHLYNKSNVRSGKICYIITNDVLPHELNS